MLPQDHVLLDLVLPNEDSLAEFPIDEDML